MVVKCDIVCGYRLEVIGYRGERQKSRWMGAGALFQRLFSCVLRLLVLCLSLASCVVVVLLGVGVVENQADEGKGWRVGRRGWAGGGEGSAQCGIVRS